MHQRLSSNRPSLPSRNVGVYLLNLIKEETSFYRRHSWKHLSFVTKPIEINCKDNLVHLHSPGGLGGQEGHEDREETGHDPRDAMQVVHATRVVKTEFFIKFTTQNLFQ